MSIDPRARMRVETVSVRPSIKTGLTNEERLALFLRRVEGGKVAGGTVERFRNQVREAIRYFRRRTVRGAGAGVDEGGCHVQGPPRVGVGEAEDAAATERATCPSSRTKRKAPGSGG